MENFISGSLSILQNMSFWSFFSMEVLVVIVFGAFAIGIGIYTKKWYITAITSLLVIMALFVCVVRNEAYMRHIPEMKSASIPELVELVNNAPDNESEAALNRYEKNEFQEGDVLVFYRESCEECRVYYSGLSQESKDSDKVWYVCTRSIWGEDLARIMNVQEVPSTYVYKNGKFILNDDYLK